MQFAELKLPVGTRVQLTFVGQDYKRHPCDGQLLGYRAGESLLVWFPKRPPQVLLRVGARLEVRLAMQSGIATFETSIDQICSQPYTYLHLNYPGSISLTPLRRVPRFAFDSPLAATASSASGVTTAHPQGRFVDISVNGARVALDRELGSVVSRVDVTCEVDVAGLRQKLALACEVRRTFEPMPDSAFPFRYGLAFNELPPTQRLLLLALCHQLQSDHGAMQ